MHVMNCKYNRLFVVCIAVFCIAFIASACNAAITEAELKTRVQEATKDFNDLSVVATVVYKNKDNLKKVDENYAQLYEFKSANVMLKMPDKLRIDGKLGMVKAEYIINEGIKIFRSPTVRINKRTDYSADPAKLQSAIDIGLVTPTLWNDRKIEILDDPEAEARGEIKLLLRWVKGGMKYYAWIDAKDLWLKRFEKRDGDDNLQVSMVYSNPQKIGGVIWMPLNVEAYAADGGKAGALEYGNIKVNTGIADSLFK